MQKKKIKDKIMQDKQEVEEPIKSKPVAIKWEELDKYVDKPVWDNVRRSWRILEGYKRIRNAFFITFTDSVDWVSFYNGFLYLEEYKNIK